MRTIRAALVVVVVLLLASVPVLAASVSTRGWATTPTASTSGPPLTLLDFLALAAGLAVGGITIRKDTASLAVKYATRAVAAAPDYKEGVSGSGATWEAETTAAEPNYESGVTAAIGRKAFGRGVRGSAAKFQENAVKLGSLRYPDGVRNAQPAWQRGVEPAFNVLKSLSLPPKGPKRSPQNQQRANAVAVALGALKEGK